jgi:serine-type D-Ala-D-Ala endopeptidase (penicillin-binding protein 7)
VFEGDRSASRIGHRKGGFWQRRERGDVLRYPGFQRMMQAQLAGRKLIMVLLDSAGKYSRVGDAERLRRWLSESKTLTDQPAT